MANERKYYVLCSSNCKFESMTKEQILAAITQAVETGEIGDVDTGFVTTIKEQNKGTGLSFWVGTQAEYNALETKATNCFYIVTDDTFADDINAAVEDMKNQLQAIGENVAAESTTHKGCYCRVVNGETEWVNPPMLENVEYRTTERCFGSPVYAKRVRVTTASVGGEASVILYSGNDDQEIYIAGIEGVLYDERETKTYPLPVIDFESGTIAATFRVEATQDAHGWIWHAKIKTLTATAAQYPADIIVKYTK